MTFPDLRIIDGRLHVTLNALSAPRRTRAIAGLCHELTATETLYPGTDLPLAYSTKANPVRAMSLHQEPRNPG